MPQNGEKQVDKSEYLFCNEKFLLKSKKKFLFSDRIRKRMIYLEKSKLKKNSKVLVYFLFNNNISKIDDLSKSPLPHKNLNEPVFVLFFIIKFIPHMVFEIISTTVYFSIIYH